MTREQLIDKMNILFDSVTKGFEQLIKKLRNSINI